MAAPQNVIAVIFDFDDTLTNDSTTKLLEAHGINANKFWQQDANSLVADGWDPGLAYLSLLIDHIGPGKKLGRLCNADLQKFGAGLRFYRGIPALFANLRSIVSQHPLSNPVVEFYVVSGGLEEVIRGSSVAKYLNGIWGCRFSENSDGVISRIKNVISFTDKTRYIFEINKGIVSGSRGNPYAVNDQVESSNRRVPFENMIYVGDGLTDVPCFSLIQHFGGKSFGVFDPHREDSPKKAWERLVTPKRVVSLNSPRYRENDDLGALLKAAVNQICVNLDLRTRTALS